MVLPTTPPVESFPPTPDLIPSTAAPTADFISGETFPAINGQPSNLRVQSGAETPIDTVCGSIQSVLAHPTDPNICFAGASNGGVWRTFQCMDDSPFWEPLTDGEESLSVGDMVFDHSDITFNTILVGIGARSSFSRIGGKEIGMLYTQNALATVVSWTKFNNPTEGNNFEEERVQFNSVFARGDLMLASANNPPDCNLWGVYRSIDRGLTWEQVLSGWSHDIASDPNDENRFYAIVDFYGTCNPPSTIANGVFTSIDGGATWTPTDLTPASGINQGELNNGKLSVSSDGSRVWSALLKNGRDATISYSDDNGNTWIIMDKIKLPGIDDEGGIEDGLNPREKPGSQGDVHFSLLANPTDRNEIYVGGDRQAVPVGGSFPTNPNPIGAVDFTGALWRGDSRVTPTDENPSPQWEHLTDLNNIDIIPGGGTQSGSAPHADSRDMELRADGSIIESDDGGITVRTIPNSNMGDWFSICGNLQVFEAHNVAYEPVRQTVVYGNQDTGTIAGSLGQQDSFRSIAGGDGGDVLIDYTSDPVNFFVYYGTNSFGIFLRDAYSKQTGNFVDRVVLCSATNMRGLCGLASFVPVAAMNPADQTQFVVGLVNGQLVNTFDRGDNFSTIATGTGVEFIAMAWSSDGSKLYAMNNVGTMVACNSMLVCSVVGNVVGNVARGNMVVHPSNNNIVFVVTTSSDLGPPVQLWQSVDGGVTFAPIPGLESAARGVGIAYIQNNGADTLVVGTSDGIVIPDDVLGTGNWKILAPGIPAVPIMEIIYEPMDDRLIVATLGRGIWFLEAASFTALGIGSPSFNPPFDPDKHGINFGPPLDDIYFPPEDYFP